MGSVSRSGDFLIALFAAIPTTLVLSFITWELLLYINNGNALNMGQAFLALFSGFSFGLAVFSFVYAARMQTH